MKRTIAKILPLLCGFTLGFTPMVAYGQLSVFPLTIQRQAESGQARGVINIFNNSNKSYRARVSLSPFTYNREGLQVLTTSPNDLTPYLTFSPRELVIAAGQKRSIRFNARLLPSLPQGEYRAMFSVEELEDNSSNSDANAENQVSISVNIAATIYVINGNFVPKLGVEKAFYDGNKKQIRLLVNNTGEATTRAKTEWNLSQNGKIVNSGKVEETTMIAKGERYIQISYPPQGKTLTPGNYQLSGKLYWNAKKAENLPFNFNFTVSPQDIIK
ncbi:P pilus assembly protein, chaperone PapD [Sphaerospermopsis sp. LEGE 08334]|uniref:P pilus assembly protein, chaperone PapD n=1 Tax=Sphaerospermopsis sp. LEGE 08334 TaxID=1828651 RepID=UPI001880AE8A|nr:P pilus assembly protein, chaperone PapD [Sphaerospermopsis sp. LEGE 08334]MBE9058958.1 P pilus assembly protein, chaperone PapD [Sphaerospermopsis sp. LEGE 08334]